MTDADASTKVREGAWRWGPWGLHGALHGAVSAIALVAGFVAATSAVAQEKEAAQRTVRFNIEAQELGEALNVFAAQSGLQVAVAPNDVRGKRSPAVQATLTPRAALDRLFESSGLEYAFLNENTVAVRQVASAREERTDGPAAQTPAGTLTGTLRGTVTQGGEPVAGVSVTVTGPGLEEPRKVTTAGDGNYQLNGLPVGTYTLRFELEGLAPVTKSVEVTAEESTPMNVQMSLHEIREDMVVVGSRLRTTPVESAMPTIVIDRAQIERSGDSTIAQVLSRRPEVSVNNNGDTSVDGNLDSVVGPGLFKTNASTVQLRGLPQGTTLVLVNGRRVGGGAGITNGGFNLGTLPLSLVERIEILPFGASAIYGGDGLAGVVNIVLKRDASGFDVRTRASVAEGYDETDTSLTWGRSWSRGSLTVTGNFRDASSLRATERSLTGNVDFTRFGGQDLRPFSGNVFSLEGCPPVGSCGSVPLDQRGNLPGLDAPVAAMPEGQDGQGLTVEDFAATAGTRNRLAGPGGISGRELFTPSEQSSLSVNGRWQLGSRLELFAELAMSRRQVAASEAQLRAANLSNLSTALAPSATGKLLVPATNPFNPFGVDVGVEYLFEDTGVFTDFEQEYIRPLVGVEGEWGRGEQRWRWELAGWLSEDRSEVSPRDVAVAGDLAAIEAALAAGDPEEALNPFRTDGGPLASPQVLRGLFVDPDGAGTFFGDYVSRLQGLSGQVSGPLFRLPAGPVEGLLGAEYQRNELDFFRSPTSSSTADGNSDERAVYGELRLPLLARGSGAGSGGRRELLALAAAVRVDESSRFEETGTTETLGLELRPVASLLLRGSYSDAFKPVPLFSASQALQLLTGATFGVSGLFDPKTGGPVVGSEVDVLFRGGIPPGLEPETSTTRSLGFVWTPQSLPGLRLSATAWNNRFRNKLASFTSLSPGGFTDDFQFLIDGEDTLFPGRVIRDPETGQITALDLRTFNLNFVELSGLDVSFDARLPTRLGTFSPSLAATFTDQYDEQVAPSTPLQSNLGVLRGSTWAPKWKLTSQLGWDVSDWLYTQVTGRWVSEYEDPEPLFTGPRAGTLQSLGDFWMFDLSLDFALGRWLIPGSPRLSETRLALSAANLTNRLPDFCNSCGSRGYDLTQYDIRGRLVSAELKFGF